MSDWRMLIRRDASNGVQQGSIDARIVTVASSMDCKDVRQDPRPTLMYTHTRQRRVQKFTLGSPRLGAFTRIAIAITRDSTQVTDPEAYMCMCVSYMTYYTL